jgi:hypothetical protein
MTMPVGGLNAQAWAATASHQRRSPRVRGVDLTCARCATERTEVEATTLHLALTEDQATGMNACSTASSAEH